MNDATTKSDKAQKEGTSDANPVVAEAAPVDEAAIGGGNASPDLPAAIPFDAQAANTTVKIRNEEIDAETYVNLATFKDVYEPKGWTLVMEDEDNAPTADAFGGAANDSGGEAGSSSKSLTE